MPATQEYRSSLIIFVSLVILYILLGKLKAKYQISWGHEASFICGISLVLSYHFYKSSNQSMQEVVEFNDNLFFYGCLPPLVFASGFNMKRQKSYENIANIMLFGVGGTVVTFFVFAMLTLLL